MHEPGGEHPHPSRTKLILAFAAVYMVWGSTYLAIRYAIQTLPPFLMAGVRFLIAGTVLYLWAITHDSPHPRLASWKPALVAGAFLLLCGNGSVVWAEKRVASGLAALLIATVPLWIALLVWIRPGGSRPGRRTEIGLVCGFAGMALLVDPSHVAGKGAVDLPGAIALVFGSLAWSVGSLYSLRTRSAHPPLMTAAMQMLSGGALLTLAGILIGEARGLSISSFSPRSVGALVYLIIFGSLIGFTSYLYLLRATTPSRASTYAFVNPVVAVILGWGIAGEPITARTIAAAAVIIAGVVIITTAQGGKPS